MPEFVHRSRDLLRTQLRDVSRSFYLTLRVLPAAIRPQIGLAYLLARATDTIADTELVPVTQRLRALSQLRARILGRSQERLDVAGFARRENLVTPQASTDAERRLLERLEEALNLLAEFAPDDQRHIRTVLATITSGQELDLERFGDVVGRLDAAPGFALRQSTAPNLEAVSPRPAPPGGAGVRISLPRPCAAVREGGTRLRALDTAAELDDYTYRVAGCVGEFWTAMCRAHVFPNARLDDAAFLDNAVRFGKGLQLVNILRDVSADVRKGRCYLPRETLQPAGLMPEDLLDPRNEARFRPAYDHWLDCATGHLRAGWVYTNSVPWGCMRVRLACAWPILIGSKTLELLRDGSVLEPGSRLKVSRAAVRNIIMRTVLLYGLPPAWRRLWR